MLPNDNHDFSHTLLKLAFLRKSARAIYCERVLSRNWLRVFSRAVCCARSLVRFAAGIALATCSERAHVLLCIWFRASCSARVSCSACALDMCSRVCCSACALVHPPARVLFRILLRRRSPASCSAMSSRVSCCAQQGYQFYRKSPSQCFWQKGDPMWGGFRFIFLKTNQIHPQSPTQSTDSPKGSRRRRP